MQKKNVLEKKLFKPNYFITFILNYLQKKKKLFIHKISTYINRKIFRSQNSNLNLFIYI